MREKMKRGTISVISAIAGTIVGAAIGASKASKIIGEDYDKMKELADKHLDLFLLMNQWVKIKQEGKSISEYLQQSGYKKVAIYGLSYVGETLLDELKDSSIMLAYGIDKNADNIYADIDVVSLNDKLDEVDVIIVTAITFFDQIVEELSDKVKCPIVSIEDILYDI